MEQFSIPSSFTEYRQFPLEHASQTKAKEERATAHRLFIEIWKIFKDRSQAVQKVFSQNPFSKRRIFEATNPKGTQKEDHLSQHMTWKGIKTYLGFGIPIFSVVAYYSLQRPHHNNNKTAPSFPPAPSPSPHSKEMPSTLLKGANISSTAATTVTSTAQDHVISKTSFTPFWELYQDICPVNSSLFPSIAPTPAPPTAPRPDFPPVAKNVNSAALPPIQAMVKGSVSLPSPIMVTTNISMDHQTAFSPLQQGFILPPSTNKNTPPPSPPSSPNHTPPTSPSPGSSEDLISEGTGSFENMMAYIPFAAIAIGLGALIYKSKKTERLDKKKVHQIPADVNDLTADKLDENQPKTPSGLENQTPNTQTNERAQTAAVDDLTADKLSENQPKIPPGTESQASENLALEIDSVVHPLRFGHADTMLAEPSGKPAISSHQVVPIVPSTHKKPPQRKIKKFPRKPKKTKISKDNPIKQEMPTEIQPNKEAKKKEKESILEDNTNSNQFEMPQMLEKLSTGLITSAFPPLPIEPPVTLEQIFSPKIALYNPQKPVQRKLSLFKPLFNPEEHFQTLTSQQQQVILALNGKTPLAKILHELKKDEFLEMVPQIRRLIRYLDARDAFDGENGLKKWPEKQIEHFLSQVGQNLNTLLINSKILKKLPISCMVNLTWLDCSGCSSLKDFFAHNCWFINLKGCTSYKTLEKRREQKVLHDGNIKTILNDTEVSYELAPFKQEFLQDPLNYLCRLGKRILTRGQRGLFSDAEPDSKLNSIQYYAEFKGPFLFEELIRQLLLKSEEEGQLPFQKTDHGYLPVAASRRERNGNDIHIQYEMQVVGWRSLGAMLAHIIEKPAYVIGPHFDPRLFEEILSHLGSELEELSYEDAMEKGPSTVIAKQMYERLTESKWEDLKKKGSQELQNAIYGKPFNVQQELSHKVMHTDATGTIEFLQNAEKMEGFKDRWIHESDDLLRAKFLRAQTGLLGRPNGRVEFLVTDIPEDTPWVSTLTLAKNQIRIPAYSTYESFKKDLENWIHGTLDNDMQLSY